jgi:hypothetical protein
MALHGDTALCSGMVFCLHAAAWYARYVKYD